MFLFMNIQRKSSSESVAAFGILLLLAFLYSSFSLPVSAQSTMTDRVLVIVNEDVITQSEFDYRKSSVIGEMTAAGQPVPQNLNEELLESMISDRLQVQEANRRGIEISDEELEQTLARFASQRNLSLSQLRASVEASGQPYNMFAESVRDSLTISRFSEYYARTRVVVPDYEITSLLEAQGFEAEEFEYEISQILIKGGDDKRDVAEQVKDEINRGMSFQQAVLIYSEALDAQQGGLIGWRKESQLPEMFVNAIKDLDVGGISQVIQSPNGFHILKLNNMKGERTEILQNKVRHLLIAAESRVAKSQAKKRAFELRQRILDGEDFDSIARIFSDDSVSAASGGDLGWVSPGDMVPPFEQAFTQLPIGQLSQPVETRYGIHLLIVEDRRKKNVSEEMKRARADNFLRRKRADREFGQWISELLEGAYVQHVAKPV